jgi:hypothetical protein
MPSTVALLAASALLAIVLLGTASTQLDHVSRLCEMAERVASGQMNASDAPRWFAARERRNGGLDRGELMKAARGSCPAGSRGRRDCRMTWSPLDHTAPDLWSSTRM